MREPSSGGGGTSENLRVTLRFSIWGRGNVFEGFWESLGFLVDLKKIKS